ncbi:hypothetical protein E4T47_04498 [Aureobasidium subglaciale]|nr:hypothetical protein E4T47_04498 [Aureobasidium subglaciale]
MRCGMIRSLVINNTAGTMTAGDTKFVVDLVNQRLPNLRVFGFQNRYSTTPVLSPGHRHVFHEDPSAKPFDCTANVFTQDRNSLAHRHTCATRARSEKPNLASGIQPCHTADHRKHLVQCAARSQAKVYLRVTTAIRIMPAKQESVWRNTKTVQEGLESCLELHNVLWRHKCLARLMQKVAQVFN